jgi:predicted transcriptional regulator
LPNIKGRRDRHDIVAEILDTARNGVVKTHIMYKARLSYGQVSEYIPVLVEKGFLKTVTVRKHHNVKRLFITTELGETSLKNLRAINRVWSSQDAQDHQL